VLNLALLLTVAPLSVFANNNELKQNALTFSSIDPLTSKVTTNKISTQLSVEDYLNELVSNSGDSAADFDLNEITQSDLEYYHNYSTEINPTHTFVFTYTDDNNTINHTQKHYVSVEQEDLEITISPRWVETAFDVGCFALSVVEFNKKPSFWNGFFVVADAAAMAFPLVPAISGVKRMIEGSTDVLKPALEKGIRPYSQLQNVTSPANFEGLGWERHHIFEKRFALQLGTNTADMFSIFIPKYDYHYQITQRMKDKISWIAGPFWSKDDILQAHINAYEELWAESGFQDEYWEFLYNFAKQKQYK